MKSNHQFPILLFQLLFEFYFKSPEMPPDVCIKKHALKMCPLGKQNRTQMLHYAQDSLLKARKVLFHEMASVLFKRNPKTPHYFRIIWVSQQVNPLVTEIELHVILPANTHACWSCVRVDHKCTGSVANYIVQTVSQDKVSVTSQDKVSVAKPRQSVSG